jgi:hypothetical protein
MVAPRHLSVKTAEGQKHASEFSAGTHKRHACRLPGAEMLAGERNFGKSGLERVPIAVRSFRTCCSPASHSAGVTDGYMLR